jgi:putative transposase
MVAQGGAAMSDSMLLSEAQMRRIEPYFPLSHGIPRVNDRRIISGIIFVIRNGLRWRDAPKEYGPHKTIYNRFIRWSRLGVFSRILAELTARRGKPEQLMIDATHLKAHRTAASLLKKGMFPDVSRPAICCFLDNCPTPSRRRTSGMAAL